MLNTRGLAFPKYVDSHSPKYVDSHSQSTWIPLPQIRGIAFPEIHRFAFAKHVDSRSQATWVHLPKIRGFAFPKYVDSLPKPCGVASPKYVHSQTQNTWIRIPKIHDVANPRILESTYFMCGFKTPNDNSKSVCFICGFASTTIICGPVYFNPRILGSGNLGLLLLLPLLALILLLLPLAAMVLTENIEEGGAAKKHAIRPAIIQRRSPKAWHPARGTCARRHVPAHPDTTCCLGGHARVRGTV